VEASGAETLDSEAALDSGGALDSEEALGMAYESDMNEDISPLDM